MDTAFRQRFWSKVKIVDDDTSCWEWQAGTTDGYGKFHVGPGNDRAHRVAYRLERGPIEPGKDVMHKCDNRLCCRPDHLQLGTRAQNTHDMVSKGRQARGAKKWTAKLSEEQVLQLRQRHTQGETLARLAPEFGISPKNASQIVCGDTWKHVGGPRRTRRTFRC
jgi:hypothetical protein